MKTVHHLVFCFLLSWLTLMLSKSVATNNGTKIMCIEHERQALLKFKQGITIQLCGLLTSWGDHEDCCLWDGIRCDKFTGHVIALHLNTYYPGVICLYGKMDPSLFELKHLRSLDLSYTDLNSSIPESIDSFTDLKHLNFRASGLGGENEIPSQLGNLSNLVSLDLSENDFLPVKSLHWLSRLTLLRYLYLDEDDLSKVTNWVQIVSNLPNLHVLSLSDCHMNDTSVFQGLFNLSRNGNNPIQYIDLSFNSLGGLIPNVFGNMHSLSHLTLSYNQFEGSIPDSFASLSSLRHLDLSNNKLQGSLPKSFSHLCNLENLILSSNHFSDDLSNVIQILSSNCTDKSRLETFDMMENFLWGSVPDTISKLSSLIELNVALNRLNGTISQGIGHLSKLESLLLYNNLLEGEVNNSHFLKHSNLSNLILSNNRALVFNVGENWIPPFQLDVVRLASCKLGPSFPKWLLTQTRISQIDISNNNISDSIPDTFWTESLLSNVFSLNVSYNKIQGFLPNLLTTFIHSSDIDLSSNYFKGPIPSFLLGPSNKLLYLNDNLFSHSAQLLCPKTPMALEYLDISNNILSGELPDCWMKFQGLMDLNLANNRLFGYIPSSIGALTNLQFLNLRNNNFSGELPKSFKNCISLIMIDLQHNTLTGYIPSSIGYAYIRLCILNLRGNNFHGRLPLSICQMSSIQMMDLAQNHLSGTIPECINNLISMINSSDILETIPGANGNIKEEAAIIEWKRKEQIFGKSKKYVILLDLSCNELQGKIPIGISSLTGLRSLNLSTNNLTGSIPSNIGQLSSLEVLDFSNNHLSGEIPISLTDVSFLNTLSVSNNNLSGRIPTSTQLQSFDASSYMGNPFLCGAPLPYCPGDEPPSKPSGGEDQQEERGNNDIYPGLYISAVLGFIVGFWGVCGTLVVKRSWRHAFFQFFDDIKDKLHVMIVVNVAKVWRKP